MAAAGEQTAKRKSRVVVWASGGGDLLLLGGGLLAATAALGVAFFVRAASKKMGKTQRSPREAEQEQKGSNTTCNGEERAVEGEGRGGIPSLLPPPPQAAPPRAPPQEEEDSGFKHEQRQAGENPCGVSAPVADCPSETVNAAATAQQTDFVRAQEKIIKESSLVRDGHGEDSLPTIVNKSVVVHESKIIKVVRESPPAETAPADGSGRDEQEEEEEKEEEQKGLSVEEHAEESSGEAGDSSMAEAEPPQTVCPTTATEPTLPSLEVIKSPKRVVMSIKDEVFHGTGQKLGVEEAEMTWKESRMVMEMREKGVMDKIVVEMREKGFSRNAQVVILLSTVFLTTLLAILLHHYSIRLLESTQHV